MRFPNDEWAFHSSVLGLFLIAPPTFISLRFLQAPYGKHYRKGWGPTVPPSLAWSLMESPPVWLTLLILPLGRHRSDPKSLALISIYLLHYIHRTFVYPLRLPKSTNTAAVTGFPVSVALMGFVLNLLNAYLQSRWVSHYADYDGHDWFWWWRFSIGVMVFLAGMVVNVKSDLVLVGLKKFGGGYKIPRGGWFEWVSCPNYFGEIVEWCGWSIMVWSWVGFGFLLYTCANLIPRARANHLWYKHKFENYPHSRKAVIPFIY